MSVTNWISAPLERVELALTNAPKPDAVAAPGLTPMEISEGGSR